MSASVPRVAAASLQKACASISSHARRRAGSFRSKPRTRSAKDALYAPPPSFSEKTEK